MGAGRRDGRGKMGTKRGRRETGREDGRRTGGRREEEEKKGREAGRGDGRRRGSEGLGEAIEREKKSESEGCVAWFWGL